MLLKIMSRNTGQGTGTLKLEGHLAQELVGSLEQECSALHALPGGLTLDLSGVTFVDRTGIQALKRLQGTGCVIRGCSELVASVLETEGIRVDCGSAQVPA